MDADIINFLRPIVRGLRSYHHHEVHGIENIPSKGKGLLVCSHSLATYDFALLMETILEERQRLARPLMDKLFFKLPLIGDLATALGGRRADPKHARKLLDEKELVLVAPGGMREALRPSREKHKILWQKRKGFARLAMQSAAPVYLAVCPAADELYHVYPSRITAAAYRNLKVPVFFARGLGPTLVPRPVKLVHHLSEAIKPPKANPDPEKFEAQVNRFHKKLVSRAEELIKTAVAEGED